MSFTDGIKITTLDDYISPSQICIVPVKVDGLKNRGPKIKLKGDTEIEERSEKVEITLTDCLACSGCITTAEEVIINEQSGGEFLKKIKELKVSNKKSLVVVSISPQSIASLSVRFKLGNMKESECKLKQFFYSLSVDVVLNTTFGRDLSLLELSNDVCKKLLSTEKSIRPVITSACPGWVCYAEKHKENELLVPLISKVRSPQHMMGLLVKKVLPQTYSEYVDTDIYHTSIMPCYDKKLEASRKEFSFRRGEDENSIREVDIVLSSLEVETMINDAGFNFDSNCGLCDKHDLDEWLALRNKDGEVVYYNDDNTGSGGYLEATLRHCAKEMYDIDLVPSLDEDNRITISRIKDNFRSVTLHSDDDLRTPLLKFAYAYGFKNIQNIVQSLRKRACKFDFIEIMACPGGCINGGGQVKTSAFVDQKALCDLAMDVYKESPRQAPIVNPSVREMYSKLSGNCELHTTYNIVPPISILTNF